MLWVSRSRLRHARRGRPAVLKTIRGLRRRFLIATGDRLGGRSSRKNHVLRNKKALEQLGATF